MYRIRDISLAPQGEQKIEWVRRNMPILNGIRASFEQDQPFAGLKVALSIHLEAKTAYLCRVLAAGFCGPLVLQIIAEETGKSALEIDKSAPGGELLVGAIKEVLS